MITEKQTEQITKIAIEIMGCKICGVDFDGIRLSSGRKIYVSKKEMLNIIGE